MGFVAHDNNIFSTPHVYGSFGDHDTSSVSQEFCF